MFYKRLSFKLICSVGGALMLSIGSFAYMDIKRQRVELINEVKRDTTRLSETITRSLHYDMLKDDREGIQRTIETIGDQEGIDKVRIFNKKGEILISSDQAERGSLVDKKADACYACHQAGKVMERLDTSARSRIFQSKMGHQSLGVINPIYNENDCYNASCHFHPREQKVLGVLDVVMSLSEVDKRMAENCRRIMVRFGAILLIISGMIGGLIFLFVSVPVRNLIAGTRKVARGEIDQLIKVRGGGEMRELTNAFNRMTTDLRRSQEEIKQWNVDLENKVRIATRDLEGANRTPCEFDHVRSESMRTVAHELRSPLAAIESCLRVVLEGFTSKVDDKQREMIARATERTSTLLAEVNALLDLARLRAVKTPARMELLPLDELLAQTVDFMRPRADERNITLEEEVNSPLPLVSGNKNDIEQLFTNLLANSIKYTPEGGVVRSTGRETGDYVEVEISDTGIGIPKEDLPMVFDEFFRAGRAKAYVEKGTGLGLTVVKQIVNVHKGQIRVESEEGKGTKFTIALPKAEKT